MRNPSSPYEEPLITYTFIIIICLAISEHQVEFGFVRDVVVREGEAVLELQVMVDQALLVLRDALHVPDGGLDVLDRVRGLDIQRDGLALWHPHVDRHVGVAREGLVVAAGLLVARIVLTLIVLVALLLLALVVVLVLVLAAEVLIVEALVVLDLRGEDLQRFLHLNFAFVKFR